MTVVVLCLAGVSARSAAEEDPLAHGMVTAGGISCYVSTRNGGCHAPMEGTCTTF